MRKKAVLYVAIGALLGIATVYLPFQMLVGSEYPFGGHAENYLSRTCFEADEKLGQYYTVPPDWPHNVAHTGLIVVFSLVFALGVSLYFKKRVA